MIWALVSISWVVVILNGQIGVRQDGIGRGMVSCLPPERCSSARAVFEVFYHRDDHYVVLEAAFRVEVCHRFLQKGEWALSTSN